MRRIKDRGRLSVTPKGWLRWTRSRRYRGNGGRRPGGAHRPSAHPGAISAGAAVGPSYPLGAIIALAARHAAITPRYWPGFPYAYLGRRASTWCCRWTTPPTTCTPVRGGGHLRAKRRCGSWQTVCPTRICRFTPSAAWGHDSGKWMTFAFVKTALAGGYRRQPVRPADDQRRRLVGARARALSNRRGRGGAAPTAPAMPPRST